LDAKVEFANAVHDTIDLIQVGDFCKILNDKGVFKIKD